MTGDATNAPDELDRTRMTFGQHLTELRARLIKAVLATVVAVGITTVWADDLMRFLSAPFQRVMRDINGNPALVSSSPQGPMITYFGAAVIAGLIVAAPVWIYQLWAFVAAGLYSKERRWVLKFAPLSFGLFLAGVTFGYAVLLPVALRFLLTFASPDLIQPWITVDAYLSLFMTLTLLLGAAFQLPVVMLGLTKAGMLNAGNFRKKRRITILLIFIVAGIVTPPDPITQPLVAIPLCLLYELGIWLCWFSEGAKRQPIDWKRWKKRAIWITVGLAVMVLFRRKLADVWGGVSVNKRIETTSTRLPWKALGEQRLHVTPEGAMRINDDVTTPMLAVVGAGRVVVMRFVRSDDPGIVVPVDSRTWRAQCVPAGGVVWKIELPDDVRMGAVLEAVVAAVRVGDADAKRVARAIVTAASGLKLPDDDEAAESAARQWLDAHKDQLFVQAP